VKPITLETVPLLIALFLMGLAAGGAGADWVNKSRSTSTGHPLSFGKQALVCLLSGLLMFPASYFALKFEFHVVSKGNPGAQGGVLSLIMALGFSWIAGAIGALWLTSRSR
jgi:hypothetical protein